MLIIRFLENSIDYKTYHYVELERGYQDMQKFILD